ncbi:MAG: TetR/AcrR family transcriptional regulator [Phycisphaerae bacterium]|nr:TetR/AcrR family transcriptional regulator [Phycisphaerae bacterium]
MTESSRERIISTAMRLFYDHGFHAVGLDRILDEVGVTKTTFYNHFESKDALIIAVLHERDLQETAEWINALERRHGQAPRPRLLGFFDLLAEWFERPDFKGCLFLKAAAEFPDPRDPIHIAATRHGASLLKIMRDLAARAGAADPDALAAQLMMLLQGAIVSGGNGLMGARAAHLARATADTLIAGATATAGAGRG